MAISFAASTTGQIFMAIMLKPMSEELGWSRSETAGAIFFGTLCGGLMAPVTGMLADRFGARLLTPVGAAVVGVALLWQGSTVALWQFYAAYAIARAVASNFLSGVAPLTTAANWFYRMRGRAMGLMSMAFPLGGSALTLAGQVLMEQAGWRAVFTTFGVLLLVVGVVPSVLLLRRRPEDVGLLPDGAAQPPPAAAGQQPVVRTEQKSWTLGEALHSPLFWILLFGVSLGTFNNGGVPASLVPMYVNKELPRDLAVWGFSIYGMFSIMGRFGWGYLLNRMHIRWVLMGMAIMGLVSTPLYLLLEGPPVLVYSAFTGFSVGGYVAFSQSIWADYYGRAHLGAIAGFAHPFRTLINGGGPVIMALCFDTFGNYGPAMWLVMLCWGLCAAALLAADPKRESAAPR